MRPFASSASAEVPRNTVSDTLSHLEPLICTVAHRTGTVNAGSRNEAARNGIKALESTLLDDDRISSFKNRTCDSRWTVAPEVRVLATPPTEREQWPRHHAARCAQFDCLISPPAVGWQRPRSSSDTGARTRSICSADTGTGCFITIHSTPSLHGGVGQRTHVGVVAAIGRQQLVPGRAAARGQLLALLERQVVPHVLHAAVARPPRSSSTATTASRPSASLCTRCTDHVVTGGRRCAPPTGRWKWNCSSSKRRPITSIELPAATLTCTVWPLSTTRKRPAGSRTAPARGRP